MTPNYTESFSADDLRKEAPFLRLDRLRVGDVLLTRRKSVFITRERVTFNLESPFLAAATFGRFSHAAIFVSGPTSTAGPLLAESDDFGAGWTPLDPLHLTIRPNEPEFVAPLSVGDYMLLRHPGLSDLSPEVLAKASDALREKHFFVKYPPFSRLATALHAPRVFTDVLRRAIAYFEKDTDPSLWGSFCSQLVTQFFDMLPVQLFKRSVPPEAVSPNRLYGATSNRRSGRRLHSQEIDRG